MKRWILESTLPYFFSATLLVIAALLARHNHEDTEAWAWLAFALFCVIRGLQQAGQARRRH